MILGDDPIESFEADWFDFKTPAVNLAKQLYEISKSSGVCCGIIGSWGSGKSSFMKLMDEYLRKNQSQNVCVTWFTAWDPGGIEDLGDAMLHRLFLSIAEKNKDLSGPFKELQEALGVRRSIRARARQALGVISKAVPEPVRIIPNVADSLLDELDSPRKVKESFDKLMDWLDKNNQTIFFFIDDLDRANGEQIRDLLSELKLYISHRRMVAVLGYDENYVLDALKIPVLPEGTDQKKYLEKIVTIRRTLPMPKYNEMIRYAGNLLKSTLDLDERIATRLGMSAINLSFGNPRRVKNLILAFVSSLSSIEKIKNEPVDALHSYLVTNAATDMGLLSDYNVREALESGIEENIIIALRTFAKKNPPKSKEASAVISELEVIEPDFPPDTMQTLRLSFKPDISHRESRLERTREFDWSISLFPILLNAASRGFKLPSEIEESSREIVVPPITKTKNFKETQFSKELEGAVQDAYVLSWDQGDMIVLISSLITTPDSRMVLDFFLSQCARFVAKKGLILWVIDDQNKFTEEYCKIMIKRAQEISMGLKHPFTFQYTPPSKIQALLTFLLNLQLRNNNQRKQKS